MITASVRLARPLATGGMGAIWVAEHATLHTEVAVKIMMAELLTNEEVAARFSREAAASARVKSPHVVQVFDHGVTATGLPFIVMELLEGRDLAQLLAVQRVLPPEQVSDFVGQACKGLSRAHAAGVVHRDIKPENLFLCEAEGSETFVKILDFGIAKSDLALVAERVTMPGAVFGTPHYMSPEQLVGTAVDHRTDLWSIGIVAYEALTGALPYDTNVLGALALAAHAPLPPPSSKRPELPAALDAWFARACAADPASRFSTASELAQGLREALLGPSTASSPVVSAVAAAPEPRARPDTILSSSNRVPAISARRSPKALLALLLVPLLAGLLFWLRPNPALLPASSGTPLAPSSHPSASPPAVADSSPWAPVVGQPSSPPRPSSEPSSVPLRRPPAKPAAPVSSTPKRPAPPTNYDDIR